MPFWKASIEMRSITARVKRDYVDGRFGQVHYWATTDSSSHPTLYCLHATAYSGQTFLPLFHPLGGQRRVVALDTPGYGSSDGPPAEIDFATYAKAIAEAIVATMPPGATSVDILGYHTGALLATEIAALYPDLVRRLILIGIPFFAGAAKAAWREKLVHVTELTELFGQFQDRWEYFINQRTPGLTLDRAFDCFVDELRAYPRDWWAHAALFDYDPGPRLPLVRAPALIINPAGALATFSRAAAALIPGAMVVELPHVGGAPFDLATQQLATEIGHFLDVSDSILLNARKNDAG